MYKVYDRYINTPLPAASLKLTLSMFADKNLQFKGNELDKISAFPKDFALISHFVSG